ncbi:MAG: hypothetical protein M0Z95_28610 [Actinomycetota bacterium]|nr:hypothetical protein [Actinomycetota bacterium]
MSTWSPVAVNWWRWEATAGMLAAQLAHPPATNQTMVGCPRSELIVAVVPEGVVKVPFGAGVAGPDADRCADTASFLALATRLELSANA